MDSGGTERAFQTVHFGCEKAAAERGQAIVTAARVGGRGARSGFANDALLEEFLQVVVEGAGAEFVFAFGLAEDLLHDAVAVAVFGGKGEEDMQDGGGKRKQAVERIVHSRSPLYRNPS